MSRPSTSARAFVAASESWSGGATIPTARISAKISWSRAWRTVTISTSRSRSGASRSMWSRSWSKRPGANTEAIVASTSSSLESKARKIVPSATPAAAAI